MQKKVIRNIKNKCDEIWTVDSLVIHPDRIYKAEQLAKYLPKRLDKTWTVYIGEGASKAYIIISKFYLYRMYKRSNTKKSLCVHMDILNRVGRVYKYGSGFFQVKLVPLSKKQYASILLTVTPQEISGGQA